jgi:hypothetical protein
MFNVFISAWPKYKDWLRAEASLTYVGVTDDDALAVDEGDRSKPLDPQINSADKFIAALAKLDPAAAAKMKYSAIFCFTECPLAATEGKIHRDLVLKTGGVMGDLCKQDFKPVWNALATKIATEAKLACEWSIPKPPGGETIDPNLVNVDAQHGDGSKIDLKKVGSKADCGTGPGWYYDDEKNPTRVLVCPATCTELQADNKAKVDVLFGCKTIVR